MSDLVSNKKPRLAESVNTAVFTQFPGSSPMTLGMTPNEVLSQASPLLQFQQKMNIQHMIPQKPIMPQVYVPPFRTVAPNQSNDQQQKATVGDKTSQQPPSPQVNSPSLVSQSEKKSSVTATTQSLQQVMATIRMQQANATQQFMSSAGDANSLSKGPTLFLPQGQQLSSMNLGKIQAQPIQQTTQAPQTQQVQQGSQTQQMQQATQAQQLQQVAQAQQLQQATQAQSMQEETQAQPIQQANPAQQLQLANPAQQLQQANQAQPMQQANQAQQLQQANPAQQLQQANQAQQLQQENQAQQMQQANPAQQFQQANQAQQIQQANQAQQMQQAFQAQQLQQATQAQQLQQATQAQQLQQATQAQQMQQASQAQQMQQATPAQQMQQAIQAQQMQQATQAQQMQQATQAQQMQQATQAQQMQQATQAQQMQQATPAQQMQQAIQAQQMQQATQAQQMQQVAPVQQVYMQQVQHPGQPQLVPYQQYNAPQLGQMQFMHQSPGVAYQSVAQILPNGQHVRYLMPTSQGQQVPGTSPWMGGGGSQQPGPANQVVFPGGAVFLNPAQGSNSHLQQPQYVVQTVPTASQDNGQAQSVTNSGDPKSRFRGVRWYKRTNKWVVQIRIHGRRKHVGYFNDEEEAAKAYQAAVEKAKRQAALERQQSSEEEDGSGAKSVAEELGTNSGAEQGLKAEGDEA